MNLTQERQSWRTQMEQGTFQDPHGLAEYREMRDTSLWRSTKHNEQVYEYVLFLEDKILELMKVN